MRVTLFLIGMALLAPMPVSAEVTTTLQLEAHDDGLPSAGLQYRWSVLAAPSGGQVRFTPSAEDPQPQVAFDLPGTYRLGIDVGDGHLTTRASMEIVVQASSTVTTPEATQDTSTTTDAGGGCGGGSSLAILLGALGLIGCLSRRASAVPYRGTSPRP